MTSDLQPLFTSRPGPNAKLWRYMSFAQFCWILRKSSFHLRRVDRFDDHFEGFWPRKDIGGWKRRLSEGEFLTQQSARRNFAALCWCRNDLESAAMWSLYGKGAESVAIATTFSKVDELASALQAQFGADVRMHLGNVQYIDHFEESVLDKLMPGDWRPNALQAVTYKHRSYAHEQEVRLLAMKTGDGWHEDGADIRFEPASLVEEVVVSPTAARWFADTVVNEAAAMGLSERVRPSLLSPSEFYG